MKTTYKRETVLDKHNIKSCRAPAVKNDMKCCSFFVDSEKKIIRKYFLRQEILGGTPKKFYVLQVPLHLMCPYRVRSLYPGLKAVRLTKRAQL